MGANNIPREFGVSGLEFGVGVLSPDEFFIFYNLKYDDSVYYIIFRRV
jgi:hypothetical protein